MLSVDPFALDEAVAAVRPSGWSRPSRPTNTPWSCIGCCNRSSATASTPTSNISAATTLRLVRAASPDEHTNPDAWPTYARLVPHVLAMTAHGEALAVNPEDTAWLLTQAGLCLWQRADLQQARRLHERASKFTRLTWAPTTQPPPPASTTSPSSCATRATWPKPAPCTSAPSRSATPGLGPDHPRTAQSLSNLAGVLADQGDVDGARRLHERALAICEARLRPDHPDTAQSRQRLAAAVTELEDHP